SEFACCSRLGDTAVRVAQRLTSARALVARIRSRQTSVREVMIEHLDRINTLNPTLNAIIAKLDDDRCVALANDADRQLARGEDVGPLHGLPWAFKDLEDAIGFPNTMGSPIFKAHMPPQDSPLVALLRRAGVIPIGKTNVPEFGMGSHTYNKVYGITRNPHDPTKSAGGSSGGAGAALATRMLPLADGSDLGGSLRNPAAWNGIVGLRPTPGVVPSWPSDAPWLPFSVDGPMARTAGDVALLLRAMSGPDPRAPLSQRAAALDLGLSLEADLRGRRVGWCPALGGVS